MYPLGTWFVSGICVWTPCIEETKMMMMMMMMMMIIIIECTLLRYNAQNSKPPLSFKKQDYSKKTHKM